MEVIQYHVIATNLRTGESESLDFTYDYDEAVRWCDEYAAEDQQMAEKGVPVDDYTYHIEEVKEERRW